MRQHTPEKERVPSLDPAAGPTLTQRHHSRAGSIICPFSLKSALGGTMADRAHTRARRWAKCSRTDYSDSQTAPWLSGSTSQQHQGSVNTGPPRGLGSGVGSRELHFQQVGR